MKSKRAVSEKAAELIKDPRFLFRLCKKIRELGAVGKIRNFLIIFLAGLTMYLEEKASALISGPSASGKSRTIETTIKVFPPESVVKRASLSRKAFAYGAESLDKKILYINEYRGGKDAQLLLRILQSEGEILHEYTASGRTRVAQRLGSPVVLTTTTDESVFADDSTRFLTLRADESPEHILAVLKAQIGPAKEPCEPAIAVWQEAIRLLAKKAKRPLNFPSWFNVIAEHVPREQVRVQRDWKRFLALTKAIALCRPWNLPTDEISFADYCVAHRILNAAMTATAHEVNENEIRVKKAVTKLENKFGRAVTTKEISDRLGWSSSMTYKHIRAAAKHGLVQYEAGTRPKNVKRLFSAMAAGRTFLPSPKRVLQQLKELGNSCSYIDPFTGVVKKVERESNADRARA
jgi:energy-coupling factor transporter ATP-binding protein EcfA2